MSSRQQSRPALFLLALAFAAVSLSSCNRGYGCPNNFSLDADVVTVLQNVTVNPLHD